ncbi:MAG TPA: tRNA (N(6)-L-threonylcarbamoyladenosine(37)-C(2))-methylthiotransferase MtaB [Lachnospiraceae bacterium]|nr:tRNA (N(6)-L-threonylcarbamoyladenosine(37)-C(2))-methylthiotransferase MtaB [Lachnospiraceae bacterium]
MKKIAFHNLGCKVNTYELDAMMQMLIDEGYQQVPFEETADIYIINTCTVTNIADRKSRQMIHKARKNNPDAVIVAVGCYVQTRAGGEGLEDIDLCIGNNHKGEIAKILKEYLGQKMTIVSDLSKPCDYDNMNVNSTSEHTRAFIKVQDGCNQFCSYCIIPTARGRVRSRAIEDVVNEITTLSSKGFKEFVITGIHLSSYGTDWDYDDIKADRFGEGHLIELLTKVDAIEGVERIRLGSLEPRIITESFLGAIGGLDSICPHFHLSLQSGCDETLKRMNRHYSAAEFKEKTELIRRYFEHPAITTDVIVGFPGETEEEFKTTKEFLQDIHFFEMHIFKYSRRKGTPADTMPGQLTDAVKTARSHMLEEVERSDSKAFRQDVIGSSQEVLFEEVKNIAGKDYWVGHTREYIKLAYGNKDSKENLEGLIKTVKVGDFLTDEYLLAE